MTKRSFILLLMIPMVMVSCRQPKNDRSWIVLFNGKDLEGWTPKINHCEKGENYKNTFSAQEGKILVNYDEYTSFDHRFGHLFYERPFSSFHLQFSYKFTDQWMEDAPDYAYRNSGVMFHSQPPETILKDQDWPISVEFQLLADDGSGSRPTGNMCSPGTDIHYNGKIDPRHCISSTSKTYHWNEWVSCELIVYTDSIIHHVVEDDTVLTYSKPQIGGGVVNGFAPKMKSDGTPLTKGYIALQSEGQGIEFKDIRIRVLSSN